MMAGDLGIDVFYGKTVGEPDMHGEMRSAFCASCLIKG